MDKIKVWTKQHENVLEELERKGRYIVKREYIVKTLEEHANLVLETYDWLVKHGPDAQNRPTDVTYPVWVSFSKETTMLEEKGMVILELEIDPSIITTINVAKWGAILNYSYIPSDSTDGKRHQKLLEDYGTSDAQAYMSQFYPQIKREIVNSWDRLFDEDVSLGSSSCYGNIWEVRKEWITQIVR